MAIIGTKAQTLHSAAAQLEVIERERLFTGGHHPKANTRVLTAMRNIRRHVAAQSAEA